MITVGTACCDTLDCDSGDCLQLTPREEAVCSTVCESGTPLSFSKIKERSGLHQEVLSRILRRLSVYGALEKVDGNYRRKLVNTTPEDK